MHRDERCHKHAAETMGGLNTGEDVLASADVHKHFRALP